MKSPAGAMLDWDDLRYFLELMRRGRLGPAAKRLNVDHSTVGRRVAKLEKTLNAKLFERALTGFVPTAIGRQILAQAEAMERTAIAVLENSDYMPNMGGTVRVATMEGLASFYLASRFAEFHKIHPEIIVELVTSTQLLSLTRREADISVSFVRPTGPRLIVNKSGQVDLKIYAAESYLQKHGEPQSVSDLQKHVFIDYVEDQIQIEQVRWLLDAIPEPNVVFRSTSAISQRNAAAAGIGLVMLPSFLAANDARLKPILVNELSVKREIWLATHEDLRLMGRVKAVTTFLKKVIARDRAFLDGRTTVSDFSRAEAMA
ncbi:MAG TPA: LysR family transcriptional regulator [Pseudolabrys sp.]|nr:LysR family transcriptional regulator [Pseudolabrys sp.]HVU21771.1 LysR family transcriptional regulator [Rhizomicrobium sp.]